MLLIPYFSGLIILNQEEVKHLLFVLLLMILSFGCKGPLSPSEPSGAKPGIHKVVVNEVLQAGQYTYLNVSEKRKKTWLAIPSMQLSKGDKISYRDGLEMNDFHSKELNRTFSSVLFLEGVTMGFEEKESTSMMNNPHASQVKPEKINVSIDPCEGCITIAKLFETRSEYSGKRVKIRGKITKINPEIMGRNWIHIQDGTEYKGNFDLTVTTDAQLSVGDTVTFDGTIALSRDFGYGYSYDVIMENGKQVK
jgi:hypothetical protein